MPIDLPRFPVGFRQGVSFDPQRTDWDDAGPRPLAWSVWYPAAADAVEVAPEQRSWFKPEPVAENAPLAEVQTPHPLVLLSHGTGGSAAGMAWLGTRLARRGIVALGVNHHGNTGAEPHRAEGFLCLWERAADLVALLDGPEWRAALGGSVGAEASVAGFSAGAYTAMLLVGARVAFSQFEPENPDKSPIRGPREFPDLVDRLPALHANPAFRRAWERRRDDFSDPRIVSATAIAPGRSVMGFAPDSLAAVERPVQLIGGDADTIAPTEAFCTWLDGHLPDSRLTVLTGGVGHYTFVPEASAIGLAFAPELFTDPPGLVRATVHEEVARLTAALALNARIP